MNANYMPNTCVLSVGTTVEGKNYPALKKVMVKCWRI